MAALLLTTPAALQAQEKGKDQAKSAREALAAPLRKYDADGDGRLTGRELVMARQAQNRGGRDVEPTEQKWREIMDRLGKEWRDKNKDVLDQNHDGKVDGDERKRGDAIWAEIARRYIDARKGLVAKYDKNDDGELNEAERDESRDETDRLRRDIERDVLKEFSEKEGNPR